MATYEPFLVGNTVVSCNGSISGVVRFIGRTEFADDDWVGLELDKPEGKNDGAVNGVRYFSCAPSHGLFLRPSVLNPCVVGNRISIRASKSTTVDGCIRFLGMVSFADGDWLGIELEKPEGKNDGCVNGVRYFHCTPRHGIFLRPSAVRKRRDKKGSKITSACAPETESITVATHDSHQQSQETLRDVRLSKTDTDRSVLAKMRRELSIAMEEHDLDELRWLVPRATKLGIDQKELQYAREMLNFLEPIEVPIDLQRALNEAVEEHDLDAIRNLVPLALKHGVPMDSIDRAIWSR